MSPITMYARIRPDRTTADRTSAGRRGRAARDASLGLGHRRVSPGGRLPSQAASTRLQRPY